MKRKHKENWHVCIGSIECNDHYKNLLDMHHGHDYVLSMFGKMPDFLSFQKKTKKNEIGF